MQAEFLAGNGGRGVPHNFARDLSAGNRRFREGEIMEVLRKMLLTRDAVRNQPRQERHVGLWLAYHRLCLSQGRPFRLAAAESKYAHFLD
jgi:hypothetical protein